MQKFFAKKVTGEKENCLKPFISNSLQTHATSIKEGGFPDLPIADIMAATEDLIEKIDMEVGQQLRVGVFKIFYKIKVKLQQDKKRILRRSNL